MKNQSVRRLTTSAVMIAISSAIAMICEFIPFLKLPFGGTITIASMLPIIIISYMYGVKRGLFTSFTYSIIQIIISLTHGSAGTVMALFLPGSDFTVIKGILIIFLDYIAAYTVLGLGGILRNRIKSKTAALICGGLIALALRYAFHIFSGAIFYGTWAEWFFTDTAFAALPISNVIMNTFSGTGLAVIYSTLYNGCYMLPEMLITSAAAAVVCRIPQLKKEV